jgi:hypothetical protein
MRQSVNVEIIPQERIAGKIIEKVSLAMTYSPGQLPTKYHRR